jgi:hypothetical protein
LQAVVSVADRKTVEFDKARAAIDRAHPKAEQLDLIGGAS